MRRRTCVRVVLASAVVVAITGCGGSGNYSSSTTQHLLTPTITWAQPSPIVTATALGSAQLDATANVPGSFTYIPGAGATLKAGTQTLTAYFYPQDGTHYGVATASVNIEVDGVVPEITWAAPSPINNPTPLGAAQLDARSAVAGSFTYSPAYGTVLPVGTHTLTAKFTPYDTSVYASAQASAPIVVDGVFDCGAGLNTGTTPFVYVSEGSLNSGASQIAGFAAAADGSLTAVHGSPLATPGVSNMVGYGSILFGSDLYSVYSYGVHANGCLSFENSAQVGSGDPTNDPTGPATLFFDSARKNLYASNFDPGTQQPFLTAFNYQLSTGEVRQNGPAEERVGAVADGLAFSSNDNFAVTSGWQYRGDSGVFVFERPADGTIQWVGMGPEPAVNDSSSGFLSFNAAADNAWHFITAGYVCHNAPVCSTYGPGQLAIYTMDDGGHMTTFSTENNMTILPALSGGASLSWVLRDYKFSPDYHYLAVSGFTGVDLFAWDSKVAALTHIASLSNSQGACVENQGCTGKGFGKLAWDHYDHLYITFGNQLQVYTVTSGGLTMAPGSPYNFVDARGITVVDAP